MATSCTNYSLAGMGQECKGAVAGLKRLLIGLSREWTVTKDDATHMVTGLQGSQGAVFYDYYINDESSSLTSTLTLNNANGVKYYQNVIAANFVRMRPEKHLELMSLANEKLVIIAVDNNEQPWFLGVGSAATATEETAQSGQSFDDASGYSVTLTQRGDALPYGVQGSVMSGLSTSTPPVYE